MSLLDYADASHPMIATRRRLLLRLTQQALVCVEGLGNFPYNLKKNRERSDSVVTDLSNVLDQMRLRSQSEFEKGEYFERLVKAFLENDDLQSQFYDGVWHYRDWASERGLPAKDIGIDLVASHADGSGFCAVQCKFYAPDHSIQKTDIDSFVSAASTKDFVSLVLVDTTLRDLSPNAQAVLDHVDREYHRIALAVSDVSAYGSK